MHLQYTECKWRPSYTGCRFRCCLYAFKIHRVQMAPILYWVPFSPLSLCIYNTQSANGAHLLLGAVFTAVFMHWRDTEFECRPLFGMKESRYRKKRQKKENKCYDGVGAKWVLEYPSLSWRSTGLWHTFKFRHEGFKSNRNPPTSNGGCRLEEKSRKHWSLFTRFLFSVTANLFIC